MSLEENRVDGTTVKIVNHLLAKQTLSRLREDETGQVEFRKGLVKLGRICGYEIIDSEMEGEEYTVRTPLEETTGVCVGDMENVVLVNVLRAATPFVEGLLKAFPVARQGVISAGRNEEAGMTEGKFPISIDYTKMPEIEEDDIVIAADPMLATGSTMSKVLEHILEVGSPKKLIVLSAVSAPEGLETLSDEYPSAELITVAVDRELNEDGFILPGLGDAGDRSFGTR